VGDQAGDFQLAEDALKLVHRRTIRRASGRFEFAL